MRIRQEQMQVFKDHAQSAFVREVSLHLRTNFPDELAVLGVLAHGTEALVRQGIAKANGYRIEARHDVMKYIELMVILGPQFDADPMHNDIPEILRDPVLPSYEKLSVILAALS